MKTPIIKLKYGLDEEVNLFLTFLRHKFFPQHRIMIFNAFPELEMLLENKKDKEKNIIKKFIKDFQKKHNKKIKETIRQSQKILDEKFQIALTELAKSMDYQWPKKPLNYIARPTILPFSPFNGRTFYFSIFKNIFNKEENNILFVAIHEISHMILFEILEQNIKKPCHKIMEATSLYFLKEILAPIIMNQKPLKKLLKIKNYLGNSLLHYLFITTDTNKQKKQITEFFQKIYKTDRYKRGKNFSQTLETIIKIILSIEKKLKDKKRIWDKYGKKIIDNRRTLNQYSKAIKIKMG